MNQIKQDLRRKGMMPLYQRTLRLYDRNRGGAWLFAIKMMHRIAQWLYKAEIPLGVTIGSGLYIGHPYCITINPHAVIGENCNIHKGVTIGQENRGKRKGTPIIGNCVWIGVNATIVGNINIGDDVLIAPNTYVNRDIPSHSVVYGNPCIVKPKENATEGYINNKI